jgi:mannosyltransferase
VRLNSTEKCAGRLRGTLLCDLEGRQDHPVTFSTAALFLALAVGGFFRFYRLGELTLNHDEPFTTYIINQAGWLQILTGTVPTERGTPPLYFLLLKAWCSVFGDREWALRFPSAALGTLAIFLIFVVGRELYYSAEIGAVAAGLLALNPMHMDYSRDARFYPLFVCLVLINSWLFVRLMRRNSKTEAVLYAITFALSIYAHVYAAFFIVAEISYAVCEWFKGREIHSFILGVVLGLVLLAPYLFFLVSDFSSRLNEQLGYTAGLHYAAPFLFYREASGSLMFPVILLLAWYAFSEGSDSTSLLSYWMIIPVFGVYLTSFFYPHRIVFTPRYLFAVVPAVLLLAAAGLWRLGTVSRFAFMAVLIYTVVAGGLSFRRVLLYKTRDWRTIASAIEQEVGEEPVAANRDSLNVLKYYLNGGGPQIIGFDCSGGPLRDLQGPTSVWFLYTTANLCDATALRNLSSRYMQMERTQISRGITLVHLIASAEIAPAARRSPVLRQMFHPAKMTS